MTTPARTLGAALRACAESFPERAAIVFQEETLSYRDLLKVAGSRAEALRLRGVAPGSRVAVYLDRGVDLVIWLMAVALAGGVQLAIDSDEPAARVERMLADAAPQLLVSQPSLAPAMRSPACEVVLGDDCPPAPAIVMSESCSPDEAAYMVYTSGSTGEPKASMISHAALLSRLSWLQRRYGLAHDDRVLLKTACGFDVFIAELYWPLTAGATLVVAPPGAHRDPDYLASAVLAQGVTTLHFVPTLLDLFLVGRDSTERYDGLRRVMAGGEALSPELVRRFYARSSATLHNLYGPSECAIYSTAWECPRDPGLSLVLIGAPVDGTQVWVLDADRQPVAPGTPGELYIGGDGVGIGYHARRELTAERFVSLTLEGSPRRLYRTGDLARDAGGGELEYLGRVDSQIKVRGYRVEPGEIEITMLRTGLVRAAAVVADFAGSSQRLVAFVVSSQALPADQIADRLLSAIREELPGYMVPAALAVIAELPVSPNGKVDRTELASRARDIRPPSSPAQSAPVTDTVGMTAMKLWKEYLKVDHVSIDNDFFELGGDSLTAVQVTRSLAAELGHAIPARILFQAPTFGEYISFVSGLVPAGGLEPA